MQIQVNSRYEHAPESTVADIERRLDKLGERYRFLQQAYATIGRHGKTHECELALHLKHQMLRAKESDAELATAVDRAFEKLEKQLRRHKGRLVERSRSVVDRDAALPDLVSLPAEESDEEYSAPRVVKVKRIAIKPSSVDEAILQMELLGHDFYVFVNDEDSQINIIYRRTSGDIGLIQPG